jgi:hypothetical protein
MRNRVAADADIEELRSRYDPVLRMREFRDHPVSVFASTVSDRLK